MLCFLIYFYFSKKNKSTKKLRTYRLLPLTSLILKYKKCWVNKWAQFLKIVKITDFSFKKIQIFWWKDQKFFDTVNERVRQNIKHLKVFIAIYKLTL